MSVLIEALTLVVVRSELDARYPGGSQAFLIDAERLQPPPRWTCGDDHLVALSFYGFAHAHACAELLARHGLDASAGAEPGPLAHVDQEMGPLTVSPWLAWEAGDGYSCAWLADTEPGDVATDYDWTPERSRALVRWSPDADPDALMQIGEQGGLVTWLDLSTGKQLMGTPLPAPDGPERACAYLGDAALEPIVRAVAVDQGGGSETEEAQDADARAESLRERILEILDAEELRYVPLWEQWVEVPFMADATRILVRLSPAPNGRFARVYATSDMRVPEEHRVAACEVLTRANWGLPIGDFELDLTDGEVVFKITIFLGEDGELGHEQLLEAVRGSVYVFQRYYPALMRVIYGGVTPRDAIAQLEG